MRSELNSGRSRVLLLGQGVSAWSALEALVERFDVVGVVRTAIQGPESDPVIQLARSHRIRVYEDATIKAIDALVSEIRPDCVIVSSYGRVLPPELVVKARFVNVHYSPLPRCRGLTAVNWALVNGNTHTGITIHTIVPGVDEGQVLFQRLIPIWESDTVVTLMERLNSVQREALAEAVERHLAGFAGERQQENEATYVCTRIPADGEINWSRSAQSIGRLVRALVDPFPGAFTYYEGQRLLVWRAEPVLRPARFEGRVPGRVVAISRKEGTVDVLAAKGVLRVQEVQREGEPRQPAAAVVTSIRATMGLRLSDMLHRVEALEQLLKQRA